MSNYRNILIALGLICLTIDGFTQTFYTHSEYSLLSKGDAATYEGVLISLPVYRTIRKKITVADSLINAMELERLQIVDLMHKKDTVTIRLTEIVDRQSKTIEEDQRVKKQLNQKYDDLLLLTSDKKIKWFKKPIVIFGVGFVSALGVVGFVSNYIK